MYRSFNLLGDEAATEAMGSKDFRLFLVFKAFLCIQT